MFSNSQFLQTELVDYNTPQRMKAIWDQARTWIWFFWVARTCRCFYQPSHWSSGISRRKGWKVVLPNHRHSLILRLIFDLSWVLQYPWSHTKVHCAYCTSINTTAATLYYHHNLQPETSLLLHTECLCFRSQDGRRLFVGERIFRLCWCSK